MEKPKYNLKLLLHGDAIWARSGYSVELDWIIRRLLAAGFPVAQAAKAGLGGSWIDYTLPEGVLRMYPGMGDPHASDSMFYGARHFGANIAISMIDIWVIPPEWIQQIKALGCKWWVYMPVDSAPPSPSVLERLPLADKIITFSKFGQKQLLKHGFVSEMIYEGVDVNFLTPEDKIAARNRMQIPADIFLWGMIAANKENPPRKAFQECLEAFKMFADIHPEARLFVENQQSSPTAFPIGQYANYLGIGNKLIGVDPVVAAIMSTREDARTWLASFDALLHPSMTEGFGLTIVEAQSMGKPVVINPVHSMPELIIEGKTGATCEVDGKWFTNAGSYWERPNAKSIAWAMEKVYKMLRENPQQVGIDCRNNVVTNFNIDTIFQNQWLPLFLDEERRLTQPK